MADALAQAVTSSSSDVHVHGAGEHLPVGEGPNIMARSDVGRKRIAVDRYFEAGSTSWTLPAP